MSSTCRQHKAKMSYFKVKRLQKQYSSPYIYQDDPG